MSWTDTHTLLLFLLGLLIGFLGARVERKKKQHPIAKIEPRDWDRNREE